MSPALNENRMIEGRVRAYHYDANTIEEFPDVVETGYTFQKRPIAWLISNVTERGWKVAGPAQDGDILEEEVYARCRSGESARDVQPGA